MKEVCRDCGCDDDHACPGGCSWARPGLCSACLKKQIKHLVGRVVLWLQTPGAMSEMVEARLGGRVCRIYCNQDNSLSVKDHIGVIAFSMSAEGITLAQQYHTAELVAMFDDLMKADA